jgi:hypothetical protein
MMFKSIRKLPVLVLTADMRCDVPILMARRAVRVNNRKRAAARAYERVHAVLAKGPQA